MSPLAILLIALLPLSLAASAAPRVPASDAEVIERLPARATDARARELLALRTAWREAPAEVAGAVALAQAYFDYAAAEGDPRYVGYAQAVLQPWWNDAEPPNAVRTVRAMLLQYDHRFDAALADLHAVVAAQPDNAQAWAWIVAIELVRADTARAQPACARLAALAPALVGAGCRAQIAVLTGQADAAAQGLRAALQANPEASPEQRRWALTRLGEIEHHRGALDAAQAAFGQALALGASDVYLLAACADLLLDRDRATEVLKLLQGRARPDVLLLRLALAAKAASDARGPGWTRELGARFDAARARGDRTHRKEEARFALMVLGEASRALTLARDNWSEQRELADARILLEAALAVRQPAAAAPVLQWLAESHVESRTLRALAARLQEAP